MPEMAFHECDTRKIYVKIRSDLRAVNKDGMFYINYNPITLLDPGYTMIITDDLQKQGVYILSPQDPTSYWHLDLKETRDVEFLDLKNGRIIVENYWKSEPLVAAT